MPDQDARSAASTPFRCSCGAEVTTPRCGICGSGPPDAPRRVEVEWLDSMSDGRWLDMETAISRATREAMLHRSVGYLIHETDDLLLLAGSRSEGVENVADTMQIPRVAVLDIHDLKESK